MSTSAPAVKGKKLPKWFWPVGIGVALIIGLYLRNRSQSNQATNAQQTGTSTDVTSNPYYYSGSGAYPDYAGYGTSPYDMGIYSGLGTGGIDPTSFAEGIAYEQSQGLSNLGTSPSGDTPTATTPVGTASTPTPVGASPGTPGGITVNLGPTITRSPGSRLPGKPATSGRSGNPKHSANPGGAGGFAQKIHKPKPKKKKVA